MSLDLSSLDLTPTARPCRQHCSIWSAMVQLDDVGKETVRAAFASSLEHQELARRLSERGLTVSGLTVSRHRNKACNCCRVHGTLG